jgi:hypothetical protein
LCAKKKLFEKGLKTLVKPEVTEFVGFVLLLILFKSQPEKVN